MNKRERKIKIPEKSLRTFSISEAVKSESDNRTLTFSFSSEEPVERYFGSEILSHDSSAVSLERLNTGAPLLFNHDMDEYIGVVQRAWIEGKRGMVEVRFSKNADAEKIYQDVLDGILSNVSVGYMIKEMKLLTESQDGPDEYIATSWEPYEVSIVTVPADISVGVGRNLGVSEKEISVELPASQDPVNQESINENINLTATAETTQEKRMDNVDVKEVERQRIKTINALAEKYKLHDLGRTLIDSDKDINEVRAAFLEKIGAVQVPVAQPEMIELSEKEKRSYSLVRAIAASVNGKWDDAGFEREVSNEIGKRTGKETRGFFMPLNVKMDGTRSAYNVGTGSQGGNLVATNLLPDSFIELLRNFMLVNKLGARTLSGLVGNIAITKQLTSGAAYWVTEGADITESEGTFGLVSMSPKTVGARSQMTRQMMLQSSPDIEMLVRQDLAIVLALELDRVAVSGLGSSGQPKGILNQSGIGSVPMGTNGAALTNIDPLIDLETLVATANADFGSLGYITNPGMVGKLKKLKTTTGEYLWNGYEAAVGGAVPGEINGYKVGRTNQVPSNLTKGSASAICSALLFGNFSDLMIGQWGPGIEILANPFGSGFNSGSVDIRALSSVDVAVRNASSFAAITDLL